MLGSWFGQKGSEDVTTEGTTPRPSFGSPSELQPSRLSADKPPKRAFPTAFSTPHDTILSDLQGAPAQSTVVDAPPNRPRASSFKSELALSPDPAEEGPTREDAYPAVRSEHNLLGLTPSNTMLPAPPISSSTELLLDPFDGMPLGVLIPREAGKLNDEELSPSPFNLPSSFDAGQTDSHNIGTEAVWSHLSRILDLQRQISKKHLEMENIGAAKGSDARKGHKHPTKNASETPNVASNLSSGLELDDEPPVIPSGLNRPERQRATSIVSTASSNGEHEENEEDINEEAEKTRMREEEFAKLATQFEGRKDAINDIMGKLEELSKALSEFHNIPSPNIEFYNPRQNANSPSNSGTAADRAKADESKQTWPASVSNRAFNWTTRQSAASSLPRPPSTTDIHEKTEPIIIKPIPEKVKTQKGSIPKLLINSQDRKASLHDSPASIGSALPQVL